MTSPACALFVTVAFLATFVITNGLSPRDVTTASISYGFQSPTGDTLMYHRARLLCTHAEVERYMFWVRLMGGAPVPSATEDCEWEMLDIDGTVTTVSALDTVSSRWASISPRGLVLRDDVSDHTVAITSPLLPLARAVAFLVQISADAAKTELVAADPSVGMRPFSNTERPLRNDHTFPSMA